MSLRTLIGAAALAALLSALPAVASAAPIRECHMAWDGARWHHVRSVRSAPSSLAWNFTKRVASCRTAREVFGATRRIRARSDRE
jgi:hypothetical protein